MWFTIRHLDLPSLLRLNFLLSLDEYLVLAGLNVNHPVVRFLYGLVHRDTAVTLDDNLLRWIGIVGTTPQERSDFMLRFLRYSPNAVSCFLGGATRLPYTLDGSSDDLKVFGPHFVDLLILFRKLCPSPVICSFLRSLGLGFIEYHRYVMAFQRAKDFASSSVLDAKAPPMMLDTPPPRTSTMMLDTPPPRTFTMTTTVETSSKRYHQMGLFRIEPGKATLAFHRCRASLENRFGPIQRLQRFTHVFYFVCRSRARFNAHNFGSLDAKNCLPIYKASFIPASWSKQHSSRLSTYFVRYLFGETRLSVEDRHLLESFDFHADQNLLFVIPRKLDAFSPIAVVRLEQICVTTLCSIAQRLAKKSTVENL